MSYYAVLEKIFMFKRAINLQAISKLKDLGLGPKQAWLLRCIDQAGPISAARLAEMTASDPAAITRSVDNLVRQGLLEKRDSSVDRRAWRLCLTARGEKMAKRIRSISEKLAEELFNVLSEGEKDRFIILLDRIIGRSGVGLPARKEG